MNFTQAVEVLSVCFNIAFIILLTKELKVCWIFGTIGSLLATYVFYSTGYFSETILYLFYSVVGIYGYIYWDKKNKTEFKISRAKPVQLLIWIISGVVAGLGLGYLMSHTEASKPYYDAMSTSFGIIATFLELYKYFAAWSFWICINAYTIWLYGIKELNFLAFQMIVFTILSIYGLITWNKRLKMSAV